MIEITIDSLKDFRTCELYYQYKYLDDEHTTPITREILAEKFETTLKRIVSYFFYRRQGYQTPTYHSLLNRWEKLWFPKGTDAYDLAREQHETAHRNIASYTTLAANALLNFHNEFNNSKARPYLLEEKYLVPLNKEIVLSGSFDLVLKIEDRYRIIQWSAKQKRPAATAFQFDFAALRLAFQHRSDKENLKMSYGLYDLASTRSGFVQMHPTKDHVKAIHYWAKEIAERDLYVPRRGCTVLCKGCDYDNQCRAWSFPND